MSKEFRHKNATASTVLIDQHYAELGLDKGWDGERVKRLCQTLRVTPHELGKLCCVDFKTMDRWLNVGRFPTYVSLHFALIESWYLEVVKGMKRKPVMPVHLLT